MELEKICDDIAEVVQDLMFNDDISISYKADILDDILSIIGLDVAEGIEPSLYRVNETLTKLVTFQDAYKIDLVKPIEALNQYIAEKEKEEEV